MNACPLCGCTNQTTGPGDGFVVCGGCAEILRPTELVRRCTRRTRRRYLAAGREAGAVFENGDVNE